MSLPLSVEIVATDISLGDNEGAGERCGWWVGKKQRTRAVASFEMGRRVVASLGVSASGGEASVCRRDLNN